MLKRQMSSRGYDTEESERDDTISFDELLGVFRRQGLLAGELGYLLASWGSRLP